MKCASVSGKLSTEAILPWMSVLGGSAEAAKGRLWPQAEVWQVMQSRSPHPRCSPPLTHYEHLGGRKPRSAGIARRLGKQDRIDLDPVPLRRLGPVVAQYEVAVRLTPGCNRSRHFERRARSALSSTKVALRSRSACSRNAMCASEPRSSSSQSASLPGSGAVCSSTG